jgi:hypothetical protein
MDAALLERGDIILGSKTPFTLYFSLFSARFHCGDRFDLDCLRHQAVRGLRRFPDGARISPNWRVSVRPLGLHNRSIGFRCPSRCLRLWPRNLVSRQRRPSTAETRFEWPRCVVKLRPSSSRVSHRLKVLAGRPIEAPVLSTASLQQGPASLRPALASGLPRPFRRRVDKAGHSHSARQPASDRRFDEIGSEECGTNGRSGARDHRPPCQGSMPLLRSSAALSGAAANFWNALAASTCFDTASTPVENST